MGRTSLGAPPSHPPREAEGDRKLHPVKVVAFLAHHLGLRTSLNLGVRLALPRSDVTFPWIVRAASVTR